MEPFTFVVLGALALKATSFVKFLTARAWRDAATQAVAWGAGIAVVVLAAQADVTAGLTVPGGPPLGDVNVASQLLIGLTLGSLGSVGRDVISAVDNTGSANEPSLGTGRVDPP